MWPPVVRYGLWLLASFAGRVYDEVSNALFTFRVDGSPIHLLGTEYSAANETETLKATAQFLAHMQSIPWITYRRDYAPLVDQAGNPLVALTSDKGWGCTLRATQMLLANAILSLHLPSEWRRPMVAGFDPEAMGLYSQVAELFRDTPDAPFGIHRTVRLAHERGLIPGRWFGPVLAADAFVGALAEVVDRPPVLERVGLETAYRGRLTRSWVIESLATNTRGVVILAPTNVARTEITPEQRVEIQSLFRLPSFRGIAGGEVLSQAYYFIAASDDYLFYLDPHTTQPALVETHPGSLDEQLPPQPHVLRMRWPRLSVSMTFAFVVRTVEEYDTLSARLVETGSGLFTNSEQDVVSPTATPQSPVGVEGAVVEQFYQRAEEEPIGGWESVDEEEWGSEHDDDEQGTGLSDGGWTTMLPQGRRVVNEDSAMVADQEDPLVALDDTGYAVRGDEVSGGAAGALAVLEDGSATVWPPTGQTYPRMYPSLPESPSTSVADVAI